MRLRSVRQKIMKLSERTEACGTPPQTHVDEEHQPFSFIRSVRKEVVKRYTERDIILEYSS